MRNRTSGGLAIIALVLAAAPAVWAGAFDVPVDPNESSLTFELCLSGSCDTDSSAVAGTVTIALDSVDVPAQIWLHDFDFTLVDPLEFNLSWGIFGSFDATITDGGLLYADPNAAQGPEPVVGDSFLFPEVPTAGRGLLAYTATGVACVALQSVGLPCSDTDDLTSEPAQAADLGGNIATASRVVTVSTSVDRTTPIDPANPDLGTIRVYGKVTGSVLVPRPAGDVDGDGDVDRQDALLWMGCCNGPDVTTPPPGCTFYHFEGGDLNGDGDVDLADAAGLMLVIAE